MAMLKRLNSKIQDIKQSRYNQKYQIEQTDIHNSQWSQYKVSSSIINKRAHHSSAILGKKMYVYGGYEAGGKGILSDFLSFDIQAKEWSNVSQKNELIGFRHSHSLVSWKKKLILFGGILNTFQSSNQIFSCEITSNNVSKWIQQKCTGEIPPPLSSHKSLVYEDCMIVFGGELQQKYNQYIYSLNLLTNKWKIVCNFYQCGVQLNSDCSISLYKDKIFIFGGNKQNVKSNKLWQYNISTNNFKQIKTNSKHNPQPRSGHCACVYDKNLIVFGGTSGITHQRNDLFVYNIEKNSWNCYWTDQQQERNKQNQDEVKLMKRSRSNSVTKKLEGSSFTPKYHLNNSKCTEKFSNQNQKYSNENSCLSKQKYRQQLKNQNYYNENYPFYGDKQGLLRNKHKKNDLLQDLEKQAREDFKHYHGLGSKNGNKIQIHLSQTFESLNNSVLSCLIQNGGRLEASISNVSQGKNVNSRETKKPKARDGHSCNIFGQRMVVFGGDRHHMSYNDVIFINLDKIIGTQTESVGELSD